MPSPLPILALGALLLVTPAAAQPRARLPTIGFLSIAAPVGSPTNPTPGGLFTALQEGLRDLGLVEGRTLAIEWRFAEWQPERLPALAAELVRLNVDVIVVGGPAGIRAARAATQTVPIVMIASSADPVGEGLVASLARPGGNVTGLSAAVSGDLLPKQLQLLREVTGRLERPLLLWDFDADFFRRTYEAPLLQAGRSLGFVLDVRQVRTVPDLNAVLAAAGPAADALLAPMGSITFAQRARVAEAALRHRLPSVGLFRPFSEAGGLMSYGPDLRDVYRRAATYVDRILKGARPGDLPVEQPARFELVVNLKTARALGLAIPPSVLLRADGVIE